MRYRIQTRLRRLWRVHGRYLLVGAVVVAVLAAMVISSSGPSEPQLRLPSQAEACAAAKRAAREAARQFPETPGANFEASAEESCRHAPSWAPGFGPAQ